MRSKIKITILALMGMSLGVNSQNQTESYFQINADNGTGYVASRLFLKSHNDYRGAGIFSTGQTNNWFIGNPYTDHANSFMIGVTNISDGEQASAQLKYAKFYLNKDGDLGIGTTSPNARLEIKGSETSYHQMIVGGGIGAAIQLESKNNTTQRPVLNGNNGNFSIQMWKNRGAWKSTPFHIDSNGMIGIGIKDTKGFKLGVNGKIAATEIKVATYSNWADFVFKKDYNLPTLVEVERHIKEKGHLKDIPSAKEVEKNGFFLGKMDSKLLQKIEELTLYTIEQEKKIKVLVKQSQEIKELKILVKKLLDNKK
ncbi:hypothetical protein [uncultured Tenacibaculum sp.]|uniref:hypothetical protein n=1 Tax=uncultured Tenacibaculum sp. TaxID=174713 RepID=UPI00262238AE|nr:hypothetical protein [uncultured Tenacibaculum sp.]